MNILPSISDNMGYTPCIPSHILGRLLDRLPAITPRLRTQHIDWQFIDRAAKRIEEASK
jgi:hypothetical protein